MRPRQREFINRYVEVKNATEAARLAGYSPKTARVTGSYLLTNPYIKAEIEARFKAIDEQSKITADNVRQSLLKEAKEADKASDRISAWRLLGLDLGLFKENTTQQVNVFAQVTQGQQVKLDDKGKDDTSKP